MSRCRNVYCCHLSMDPLACTQCLQGESTLGSSPLDICLTHEVHACCPEAEPWAKRVGTIWKDNQDGARSVVIKSSPKERACGGSRYTRPPWIQGARPQWTVGRTKLLLNCVSVNGPDQNLSQDQPGAKVSDSLSQGVSGEEGNGRRHYLPASFSFPHPTFNSKISSGP